MSRACIAPWWQSPVARLYHGHALDTLRAMPDESVHCVVTSPPYWSLRDYGLPPLVWDGDPACEHVWGDDLSTYARGSVGATTLEGRSDGEERQRTIKQSAFCRRCGVWRGCLGLEPTPELYVQHLVLIFREVRRVLRRDGTCWLNIGDAYATGAGRVGECPGGGEQGARWRGSPESAVGPVNQPNRMSLEGLKPKDLALVPFRLALALQADGWYVRSDIIWAKANPMPESVRDRPTTSHDHLFLLTKSERYYYDANAIREPGQAWYGQAARFARTGPVADHVLPGQTAAVHRSDRTDSVPMGRNRRDVWMLASEPCPVRGVHFATFPEALVEPCVLAGTSEHGVCAACGAPYMRVVDRHSSYNGHRRSDDLQSLGRSSPQGNHWHGEQDIPEVTNLGWRATCACPSTTLRAGVVPATVLDPFCGTGTTNAVAARLGRRSVGIDLSERYLAVARRRIEGVPLSLAVEQA